MEFALTSKLSVSLIGLFNFSMSDSLQSEISFAGEKSQTVPATKHKAYRLSGATSFYPMS